MENKDNFRRSWGYIWGTRILIGFTVFAFLTVLLVGKLAGVQDPANFVTVNSLALLAFVISLIGLFTSRETARIMSEQAAEMELQRKANENTVELTKQVVEEMRIQSGGADSQLSVMGIQAEAHRNQADQLVRQSDVMESQLLIMRSSLEQTDKMFYTANRPYIGVTDVQVRSVENSLGFPEKGGLFSVVVKVTNRGRTPALNFSNTFRAVIVECDLPREEWGDAGIEARRTVRPVPQILPDAIETITGDASLLDEDTARGVINGGLVFVLCSKFIFNALGIKDETFITYHVYDYRHRIFIESSVWPPEFKIGEKGISGQ